MKRCLRKLPTARALWCANCARLDEDCITDKRRIAAEYPCLGAVDRPEPTEPEASSRQRASRAATTSARPSRDRLSVRDRYTPDAELRNQATGHQKLLKAERETGPSVAPLGAIAASFANAQANRLIRQLRDAFDKYNPEDGTSLDPSIEALVASIEDLVKQKAAAQQASERSSVQAARVLRDADKVRRQLAASEQKSDGLVPHQPTIEALIGSGFGSDSRTPYRTDVPARRTRKRAPPDTSQRS